MPKYSFVIPVYNCRQYLEECVNSVLDQTVSDLEILLVDDGSADGSGELCDKLAERDERIRVFHKENGGAGSARNLGIENCEGRYLLFVDGDDTIEPDCLESAEPILGKDGVLPIFGMSFDYWRDGQIIKNETYSIAFPGERTAEEVVKEFPGLFEDNALSSACNKVFSAKLLKENNLRFSESMPLYEDLAFVLECLPFFDRVHVIDKPLYHYRNLVGKEHLKGRVSDLDMLRENLSPLNRVFCEYGFKVGQEEKIATVSANLYLMLLERHLLTTKPYEAELEKLQNYIQEESFRRELELGAALDEEKRKLKTLIEQGRLSKVRRMFIRRKANSFLRRTAKRLLGR